MQASSVAASEIALPPSYLAEFLLGQNIDEERQEKPMARISDRWLRLGTIAAALLGGSGLIVVSPWVPWSWLHDLFPELGKAVVIAGIVALIVEPYFRRAFARDVFREAFGYHLPDDFKQEIARIARYDKICTKHVMEVKIQSLPGGDVRILVTIERHIKNVSSLCISHQVTVWADEWGLGEASQVHRCEIMREDGKCLYKFDKNDVEKKDNWSLYAPGPSLWILPKHTVITVVEYAEIRRLRDHFYVVFLSPTREPEIKILEHPPELNVVADFGTNENGLKPTGIAGRFALNGVYFPPAPMRVQWWPKKSDLWPPKL